MSGGYDSLYEPVERRATWAKPAFERLTDTRRIDLFNWVAQRDHIWFDDRVLPSREPVFRLDQGRRPPLFCYSNVADRLAVIRDAVRDRIPNWPLMDADTRVGKRTTCRLYPIKPTDLACFKEAFLGKNIRFSSGQWAFAVLLADRVAGFLEFARPKFGGPSAYMLADFAVPGTAYAKLSKLIVMLAVAGETRRKLERLMERRCLELDTTAFTERPSSMKYRGVLEIVKRGETETGEKYLNYRGTFNDLSHQETYRKWRSENAV